MDDLKRALTAAHLAVQLTQSFQLTGKISVDDNSLTIADDDSDPTLKIYFDERMSVEFTYSTNLRHLLVLGTIKSIEDAGFKCDKICIKSLTPKERAEELQAELVGMLREKALEAINRKDDDSTPVVKLKH